MTDPEISKALALAIGWKPCDIREHYDAVAIRAGLGWPYVEWPTFDYRDWSVIGPIAERYDCFPYRAWGKWQSSLIFGGINEEDTPQKAIALAVIALQGDKK